MEIKFATVIDGEYKEVAINIPNEGKLNEAIPQILKHYNITFRDLIGLRSPQGDPLTPADIALSIKDIIKKYGSLIFVLIREIIS